MKAASLAIAAMVGTASAAVAAERLKMATIAPGSSAYLVMTTMAQVVNGEQDRYEIVVDATGAATKHMVELAQGRLDFSMTSPTIYLFMQQGKAMYQKLSQAPELAKNLRLVFWFPYGAYHFVTYAEDGILKLADLRGRKVFLGPPGGGAWNAAAGWVKAQTGMEPGKDFENFKASWSSAYQAFQDRQVDVYTTGCIPPCPQIEQLAATSKLRLLGLTKEEVEKATPEQLAPTKAPGRYLDVIPAGVYGEGVVNEEDVYTLGSMVGVATRADLPEETVYEVTKAFWEGAEKIRANAPWLARVTLDYAVQEAGMRLHPGAQRYYEEIGVPIPQGSRAQ